MRPSLLAAISVSLPLLGHAQEAQPQSATTQTFAPEDFSQFAPRTALEMVEQIPGFRLPDDNGGGDDARGFGQADDNVLINGQRISSKSLSAQDALNRIPAANVIQIEVLEGASLDMPGLSGQVVNIIAKNSGVSGTWAVRALYRDPLELAWDIFDLSVSGEKGNLQWTVGLSRDYRMRTSAGRENITDSSGTLLEYRTEGDGARLPTTELSGTLTWTPQNSHIANLNARLEVFENDRQEYSNRFQPDGTEFARLRFDTLEDEESSEFSGDYEFGLGPGRLKLIGLHRTFEATEDSRAFGGTLDGSDLSSQRFEQTIEENESILRSEYNWSTDNNSNWQISLEGARNTLDSDAALFESATLSDPLQVPLQQPNVTVEEDRAEAFLTYGRYMGGAVNIQVSLGAEVSEISSSAINSQTRKFTRPKGAITTTWQVSPALTLNTSLKREVGQLEFNDFVNSVDLDQGDDNTGNVDIVPEQSWRLEIEAERRFGQWGALTASVFGEALEDVNDQVPIFDTNGTLIGEGPGNIETGSRYGARLDGTFKFDPLGFSGAQLDYSFNLQDSEVEDPLTGITRQIAREESFETDLEFRHDIIGSDYAYGVTYRDDQETPSYRLNAKTDTEASRGSLGLFAEHKNIFGLTGRIQIFNVTDQDRDQRRFLFAPDRTGRLRQVESRSRNSGPFFRLALEGSF